MRGTMVIEEHARYVEEIGPNHDEQKWRDDLQTS